LSWLEQVIYPFTVYNKGDELPFPHTPLVNAGREADSYLWYIIDHYDTLPDFVVFCQGNPFDHCPDFFIQYQKEEFTFLGTSIEENLTGVPFDPLLGHTMLDVLQELNVPQTQEGFTFSRGAQYIVPKEMILDKSYDFWKQSLALIHRTQRGAWAFERLWPTLFSFHNL
jgi:hypothetical protein